MEISKGLQLEIHSVQSKLKNAIRDHQIYVEKLKDDPNNSDILERIREIQLHIVSLGRYQKQVVQRLRKEVDEFKAVNANEVKVSVASLLGLNNNNHITADNESRKEETNPVRVVGNGLDNIRLAPAKEDYEDVVQNGDIPSHRKNSLQKDRSVSVETLSADDEVMEVSVEDDARKIKREMSEESLDERRVKCTEQLSFLEVLGLITTLKSAELQNRRAERKRRSTANPQFVYSSWDVPTKKKRHSYLQSAGNVPQTRQTTARLNGPSPPPISTKSSNLVLLPKSVSPPSRTNAKSLIPTQKATNRPNILRSMSESRVYPNKSSRVENENPQSTCAPAKISQPASKTVHIPGLPSGLTIERIENDTAVCINCRNPGIMTNCENCEAHYHVSCHTISPPPPRLCPKCVLRKMDVANPVKNEELAPATYAPGVVGKAGEDPEIDKTSCRLYKIGSNGKQQIIGRTRCINKLSGSTFIIPITPNTIATGIPIAKPAGMFAAGRDGESGIKIVESDDGDSSRGSFAPGSGDKPFNTTTIVINNQLSRSDVTYVPQPYPSQFSYSYQLPVFEKYEKFKEAGIQIERRGEVGESEARSFLESRPQEGKSVGAASGLFDDGQRGSAISLVAGGLAETLARSWKKSSTRAVPGLTRIVQSADKRQQLRPVASDHGNNDDLDELQEFSYNGRSSGIPDQRSDGISCDLGGGNDDAHDGIERSNLYENTGERRVKIEAESLFSRGKSEPAGQYYTLLPGYNKPDSLADRPDQSELHKGAGSLGRIANNGGRGDDNSDELSADSATRDGSECRKLVASTEHVKLEEAHLSAPSRAKLINENDDEAKMMQIPLREKSGMRLYPSRRRTTEDRPVGHFFGHDFYDGVKYERRQMPRILMRSERKSLDLRDLLARDVVEDKEIANIFSPLSKKSSDFERATQHQEKHSSSTDDASSPVDMLDPETAASPTERKDEVESESELITRDSKSRECQNLKLDEEGGEDTEDDEDQDCPIVDEDTKDEGMEGLRISTVSPESMQVLEQFESAMKQENSDKTANP